MSVGTEDTLPETPGAKRASNGAQADQPVAAELFRALQFIERRVNDTHHAVNGDPGDSDDTGIKGAVQRMGHEVHSLRRLVIALIVLVTLPMLAIAVRSIDATARDWGLWAPPVRVQSAARPAEHASREARTR